MKYGLFTVLFCAAMIKTGASESDVKHAYTLPKFNLLPREAQEVLDSLLPSELIRLVGAYHRAEWQRQKSWKISDQPIKGIAYDSGSQTVAIVDDAHNVMIFKNDIAQSSHKLPLNYLCYRNCIRLNAGEITLLAHNTKESIPQLEHYHSDTLILKKIANSPFRFATSPLAYMHNSTVVGLDELNTLYIQNRNNFSEKPSVTHRFYEKPTDNTCQTDNTLLKDIAITRNGEWVAFVCGTSSDEASFIELLNRQSKKTILYDFTKDFPEGDKENEHVWYACKVAIHSIKDKVRTALLSRSGELRIYNDTKFKNYKRLRGKSRKRGPSHYHFDTSAWRSNHRALTFSNTGEHLIEHSNACEILIWNLEETAENKAVAQTVSIDKKPLVFHLSEDDTLAIGDSSGSVHVHKLE